MYALQSVHSKTQALTVMQNEPGIVLRAFESEQESLSIS